MPIYVQAAKVWLMTRQANTAIAADLIDKVDDTVRSDCHVTLRMMAKNEDVSVGTMWPILHDKLSYRKV